MKGEEMDEYIMCGLTESDDEADISSVVNPVFFQ